MRQRKGDWRPGMPAPIARMILWLMVMEILSRGADYATGDRPGVTSSLTVVEAAMPLPAWGACCLIAGSIVTVGIAARRAKVVALGAAWSASVYVVLAVGLALRMVERGWPWDGWRTPVHFLMMSLLWAAISVGTLWRRRLDQKRREHHGPGDIVICD